MRREVQATLNRSSHLTPTSYGQSVTHRTKFEPLDQIERMLDCIVTNEAEPDVVQVSGGEPTIHPQFFDVLDAAQRRPIRHLLRKP